MLARRFFQGIEDEGIIRAGQTGNDAVIEEITDEVRFLFC